MVEEDNNCGTTRQVRDRTTRFTMYIGTGVLLRFCRAHACSKNGAKLLREVSAVPARARRFLGQGNNTQSFVRFYVYDTLVNCAVLVVPGLWTV